MTDIKLPKLGEGISSVEISDVLVKSGDNINLDDPLIVVETEKASMEIPSTSSGIVNKIYIKKGETISPGNRIISISKDDIEKTESEIIIEDKNFVIKNQNVNITQQSPSIVIDSSKHTKTHSTLSPLGQPVLASPAVRRFARELGCDLTQLSGTGTKGRITLEDVQKYIKMRLSEKALEYKIPPIIAPGQELDFSKFGNIEIKPLNKIKKITGERLQQAWQAIPHVTQFDKCDITKLEKFRKTMKKENPDPDIKISLLPFFIKSLGILLGEMPQFNSSLDMKNENLILKKYFNIGVAIDTPSGLVVPVVKNIEKKSIVELSLELTKISNDARRNKLSLDDMVGGCFTISSLGGIGGSYFTPIVNPPEVAILGISRSSYKQVFNEGKFRKRLVLPFSLSYDHRVIDGADAARFTTRFGQLLTNLKNMN